MFAHIDREALPLFETVRTPELIAKYIHRRDLSKGRLPYAEHQGYSWLLAGNLGLAEEVLEGALVSGDDAPPVWKSEARMRVEAVLDTLRRGDPSAGGQLLERWRTFTIDSLKLSGFARSAHADAIRAGLSRPE